MFEIEYGANVAEMLQAFRAFERKQILDKIEEQLRNEPAKPTKNKKILAGLKAPWEHQEPMWELRIGEFRVFYDVDEDRELVTIRAVRHKPPHKTTEEIDHGGNTMKVV